MWQNIDTVAELNECDNEGRLNKMVRDDIEELRLSNTEGDEGKLIYLIKVTQLPRYNYLHTRKLAKNCSKQN